MQEKITQKFSNMYTWEGPRKMEQFIKIAEILTLNTISAKEKKRMLGTMVWDLRREEGS